MTFAEEWRQRLLKENYELHALSYAEIGWKVLPLWWLKSPACVHKRTGRIYNSVCACPNGFDCPSPGKHPILKDGVKGASNDAHTISYWWHTWGHANVGIAAGSSDLLILDVDAQEGVDALDYISKRQMPLQQTVTAVPGGAGRHYFFKRPREPEVKNRTRFGPGLDIRCDNGYVVAAPSLHESGLRYQWIPNHAPHQIALADPPDWLIEAAAERPENGSSRDFVAPEGPGNLETLHERVGPFSQGQRNDSLYRLAYRLTMDGETHTDIEDAILRVNGRCCQPPLRENEVLTLVKSAQKGAR